MHWNDSKEKINKQLSVFLKDYGFLESTVPFEWSRYVNDVCQLIVAEKMRGDHLRLRVFIAARDAGAIGGNVTRYAIEGGGDIVGGDYFWPVGTNNDQETSLKNIRETISRIAVPWFSAICSVERLVDAKRTYIHNSEYSIRPSVLDLPVGRNIWITGETVYWSLSRTKQNFMKHVSPLLAHKGFSYLGDQIVFTRTRNEITDVLEIVPINHGVHTVCYAYNWVGELSASDNKSFTLDSRIMFVGGVLENPQSPGREPAIFVMGSKTAEKVGQILLGEVVDRLSIIESKSDFVRAASPVHKDSLRAFGL